MPKARPNDACPCGSGRKYKKCCGSPALRVVRGPGHTPETRERVFAKLATFVAGRFIADWAEASAEFWGELGDYEDELPEDHRQASAFGAESFFHFDYRLPDGSRVVDAFLQEVSLDDQERSFVEQLGRSTMRVYEVLASTPGSSITLHDLLGGETITVHERSASRSVARGMYLATRVIPRGCSGRPEMEGGVLALPRVPTSRVLEVLGEEVRRARVAHPEWEEAEIFRDFAPAFHQTWVRAIFEPELPELRNTDDEPLIQTRVSFHVRDVDALTRVLDGADGEGLLREGSGKWGWTGAGRDGGDIALGAVRLEGELLTLTVNSVQRGERARALLERLGGELLRHRATTHEDTRRQVAELMRARSLGQSAPAQASAQIPSEIQEAVVQQYYAEHYRKWVDEPVPALDGLTPRAAARRDGMRPRVEALVRDLEDMYERALRAGQPAYDPSWLRDELGLTK